MTGYSKDYMDGFKAAYRLGPTSVQAQIIGKEMIDEINTNIYGPKAQRMDRLRKEEEMSKISSYSKDYKDGFKTAYILGSASALAQIHKWKQEDDQETNGRKIIDGLTEAILTLKEVHPVDDMKIAIYEFLLKCKPILEEEGEYFADGTVEDQSQYHMSCKRQDMETLAFDLGVTIRGNESENEWEAIKRFLQNEIDEDERKAAEEKALMDTAPRGVSWDDK